MLLIHLKRFSFNGPFTDKLETQVDFPVKGLDLTKYLPSFFSTTMNGNKSLGGKDPRTQDPPFIYDLYGVVNHFGNLSSGHCAYTNSCMAPSDRDQFCRYSTCIIERKMALLWWLKDYRSPSSQRRGMHDLHVQLMKIMTVSLRGDRHTSYFTNEGCDGIWCNELCIRPEFPPTLMAVSGAIVGPEVRWICSPTLSTFGIRETDRPAWRWTKEEIV